MDNKILNMENPVSVPPFETKIKEQYLNYTQDTLKVMQINLGKLCNLSCNHCHVEAGPNRTEIMSKEIIDACLTVFKQQNFKVLDITGGAPEMNPHFEYLIKEASKISKSVIVRTNLVILDEPEYMHLIDLYRDLKIELVCSLPCYTMENTDFQRGQNVFNRDIKVLKKLNEKGYGMDESLQLNLVYNPLGAFLPAPQELLEKDYKEQLFKEFSIVFNKLFVITNNPIGRFKELLNKEGALCSYMQILEESFNEKSLPNMMCRNQLSVAYNGKLYDCDFNQAQNMEISTGENILDFVNKKICKRKIQFGNHCYACTAGQGSSCGGAIQ